MDLQTLIDRIAPFRIIPVASILDAASVLTLADVLIEGGLPIVEVTFRTPAAAEAIQRLREERPDLLVGAGTVLTLDNLEAAAAAEAQFLVAPGINAVTVEAAADAGLPIIPGVATPSEIEGAMSLGCRVLKFFPAEALGGPAMLTAVSAPYRHTGVKFIPTGGVNPENIIDYLNLDTVLAVGASWIAPADDITAGRWDEIRQRCQAICDQISGL